MILPKYNFDIEKFLSTKLKPQPEETYETYEIDCGDEPTTA